MTNEMRDQMQIEHIQDGDNRRRMVFNGQTLGWITTWYKSDAVNKTGIKMFSAKPIGLSAVKHDCETYKSAEAYILGYHSEVLKWAFQKKAGYKYTEYEGMCALAKVCTWMTYGACDDFEPTSKEDGTHDL